MDDFSIPGVPNAFGLWPSPCLCPFCMELRVFCLSRPDNYPETHKRPLSSIAPTIIEYPNGSFYVALGASGGSKIFPAIFQVILNLDWGLDVGSAIEYGRLHHQLYPEWIEADPTYPRELLFGLEVRGHTLHGTWRTQSKARCYNITLFLVMDINRPGSVVNAVLRRDDIVYGTCMTIGFPFLRPF